MNNGDNIIDSRDVISRHQKLESEYEDLCQALTDSYEEWDGSKSDEVLMDEIIATATALRDWDDIDEYRELCALVEEAEDCADWIYGTTLILDSYFEEFAQQLAEDIGAVKGEGWPNHCIDWERAAEELRMDYTSVNFGDNTYWIRS